MMGKRSASDFVSRYAVVIILFLLIITFGAIRPQFLTVDNGITILKQASIIGVMGVGLSIVFLSGGFDLSIGATASLTTLLAAQLMSTTHGWGWPPVLAILATMLVCLCIGTVNGFIVTKTGMPPLIATLSTQAMISGFSLMMCGGKAIYGLPESMKVIGQGWAGPIPIPVIIMIVTMLLASLLLNKTHVGRYLYTVGSNAEVARLSGVRTDRIKILAYVISAFCSFVAGIILMSRLNSGQPEIAANYPMLVVTACVAGGVSISGGQGAMSKVFVGILLVSVLSNGFTILRITDYWQSVTQGAILLLAVGFDSIQKKRAAKA